MPTRNTVEAQIYQLVVCFYETGTIRLSQFLCFYLDSVQSSYLQSEEKYGGRGTPQVFCFKTIGGDQVTNGSVGLDKELTGNNLEKMFLYPQRAVFKGHS